MTEISRLVHTSLAARYWNSRWSHAENQARYGRQASSEGLGGNWRIELGGPVPVDQLDSNLAQIKSLLDHRCLFTDIPEFSERPSTPENVTAFLAGKFLKEPFTFLTVHESDHLSCTARAGEMELRMKVNNLTLTIKNVPDESGLMTSRELVTQSVIDLLADFGAGTDLSESDWARTILARLRLSVPGLTSLRVDLRLGKYIVVE